MIPLQASISCDGFGDLIQVQQTDITECLNIVDMTTDHLWNCKKHRRGGRRGFQN